MRYTVDPFFSKTTQYRFFTAHRPPYYQERMAISVYSVNVMKYMENRITQWINSALYDKGTNLIRPIFEINIMHCRDRYLVHVNCDKTYDKLKLISFWIKRVEELNF